jgi:hypothetical protein
MLTHTSTAGNHAHFFLQVMERPDPEGLSTFNYRAELVHTEDSNSCPFYQELGFPTSLVLHLDREKYYLPWRWESVSVGQVCESVGVTTVEEPDLKSLSTFS